MTKVLSVSFNVDFCGEGIVNNNNSSKRGSIEAIHAKKTQVDENTFKPYVSRDCILHEVLAEPFGFKFYSQSPQKVDRLRVNLSKWRILRGNLDATKDAVFKRKSSFCMTNAMPTDECGYIQQSISGKGNMGGVFHADMVGDTHHTSFVSINLSDLQFLSTDGQLSAATVSADDLSPNISGHAVVKKIWEENYPDTPFPTVSYFNRVERGPCAVSTSWSWSTQGVKLSDLDVANIVKWFVERLGYFNLEKAKSYLKFDKFRNVEIKTDRGVIKLSSIDQLKEMLSRSDFEVWSNYEETNEPVLYEYVLKAIDASKEEAKKAKS